MSLPELILVTARPKHNDYCPPSGHLCAPEKKCNPKQEEEAPVEENLLLMYCGPMSHACGPENSGCNPSHDQNFKYQAQKAG